MREIPDLKTDDDRADAFLRGLKPFDTLGIGENVRQARAKRSNGSGCWFACAALLVTLALSHDRS